LVERNDNLIEQIKDENENVLKKTETMVTDNYTEQVKISESNKETIKENGILVKQEADKIKEVIEMKNEEILCEVNDLKENVKENGNKLAGLEKDFEQIVMRSALRENAMLGRLDNFKDEFYETRKILGIQIDYLQNLEGKIKDVGNLAGNMFGKCNAHVRQLNSSLQAMFGVIEDIKRSIFKLSEGQISLEKKVDDAVVEIRKRKVREEEAKKESYCSRGKGKGKKRKEFSDDNERGNYPNIGNEEEKEENEELVSNLRNLNESNLANHHYGFSLLKISYKPDSVELFERILMCLIERDLNHDFRSFGCINWSFQ
jgi:hypothetical protein